MDCVHDCKIRMTKKNLHNQTQITINGEFNQIFIDLIVLLFVSLVFFLAFSNQRLLRIEGFKEH